MRSQPVRLVAAMARRELDGGFLLSIVLAAAGGVTAAWLAPVMIAEGVAERLVASLLARYDSTLLGLLAFVLLLRTADRAERDTRDGWLEPLLAPGTQRAFYAAALMVPLWLTSWLVAATGTVAFALAIRVTGGSTEAMVALPFRLGGAALLLLGYSAWGTLFALLIRRAAPSFLTAVILAAIPVIATLRYAYGTGEPPLWVFALLLTYPTVLLPQSDTFGVGLALIVIACLAGLAMLASRRFMGRRA